MAVNTTTYDEGGGKIYKNVWNSSGNISDSGVIGTYATVDGKKQYTFSGSPTRDVINGLSGIGSGSIIKTANGFVQIDLDKGEFLTGVTGWNDPKPLGDSGEIQPYVPPSGTRMEYRETDGQFYRDIISIDTNTPIGAPQFLGSRNADGSISLNDQLDRTAMSDLGIGADNKISIGGQPVTYDGQSFSWGDSTTTGSPSNSTAGPDLTGIPGYNSKLVQDLSGTIPIQSGATPGEFTQDELNYQSIKAYTDAQDANNLKFGTAYQGAAQNYQEIMDSLEGAGTQQKIELRQNYSNAGNAAQNDLIQRGVSGSTVKPAVQMGYQRQQGNAMNTLNENLSRERIGYKNDAFKTILGVLNARSDPYPDTSTTFNAISGTA